MTTRGRFAFIAFAALTMVVWCTNLSCISSATRPNVTRPPTLGAELMDLDRAHRVGLLTDAEYTSERAKAIARFKQLDEQLPTGTTETRSDK